MDKKSLLKGGDSSIKGHIDTYEYISNTFKNLHDQQMYLGGVYGHNDPLAFNYAHTSTSDRLQSQSIAV